MSDFNHLHGKGLQLPTLPRILSRTHANSREPCVIVPSLASNVTSFYPCHGVQPFDLTFFIDIVGLVQPLDEGLILAE